MGACGKSAINHIWVNLISSQLFLRGTEKFKDHTVGYLPLLTPAIGTFAHYGTAAKSPSPVDFQKLFYPPAGSSLGEWVDCSILSECAGIPCIRILLSDPSSKIAPLTHPCVLVFVIDGVCF